MAKNLASSPFRDNEDHEDRPLLEHIQGAARVLAYTMGGTPLNIEGFVINQVLRAVQILKRAEPDETALMIEKLRDRQQEVLAEITTARETKEATTPFSLLAAELEYLTGGDGAEKGVSQ